MSLTQMSFFHMITVLSMLGAAAAVFTVASRWHWMVANQMDTSTFFGISVAEGFSETTPGKLIFRHFRLMTWTIAGIVAVLALLLFQSAISFHLNGLLPASVLLGLLYRGALRVAYWRASRRTKAFAIEPDPVRRVNLAPPLALSALWRLTYITVLIIPVLIILLAAHFLQQHWSAFPGHFPLAWLNGRYQDVSPRMAAVLHKAAWNAALHTFNPLVLATLVWLGSIWLAFAFLYRSRLADWTKEVEVDDHYRRMLMMGSALTQLLVVLGLAALALLPFVLNDLGRLHTSVILMAVILSAGSLYSLFFFFRTYSERPKGLNDRTFDSHWKLGQFYWNPDDPAWIVPDRVGAGQTLNLGRGAAWIPVGLGLCVLLSWPTFYAALPEKATHSSTAEWAAYRVALDRLKHGDHEEAALALLEFAETHTRPRNYIAVSLAEAGVHRQEAQALAERSVASLEKHTAEADPAHLDAEQLKRINLLARFWDGLGKVYLIQGKLDLAEHYVVAAWTLRQEGTFALHLGQIALARGDQTTAKDWFRTAIGYPLNIDDIMTTFRELRVMGDERPHFRPAPDASVAIPTTSTLKGSGEVELVFQHGKEPQMLWIKGSDAIRALPIETIVASLPNQIPDSGRELVVRYAMLGCPGDQPCRLRFFPLGSLPEEDGGPKISSHN